MVHVRHVQEQLKVIEKASANLLIEDLTDAFCYIYIHFLVFALLGRLYDTSNSLPSSEGSSVSGSRQCPHMSTRPSIFVCFPQFGQIIWAARVDK